MDRNFILAVFLVLGLGLLFSNPSVIGYVGRGAECTEIDLRYGSTICRNGDIFEAEEIGGVCKLVLKIKRHQYVAEHAGEFGVTTSRMEAFKCYQHTLPGGKKTAEFVFGPNKDPRWLH